MGTIIQPLRKHIYGNCLQQSPLPEHRIGNALIYCLLQIYVTHDQKHVFLGPLVIFVTAYNTGPLPKHDIGNAAV